MLLFALCSCLLWLQVEPFTSPPSSGLLLSTPRKAVRSTNFHSGVPFYTPLSMSSQQEESTKIKRELVDALDLYPILRNVAKHAGTKRAIDAFMQLVTHEDDSQKKNEFYANYNNSK